MSVGTRLEVTKTCLPWEVLSEVEDVVWFSLSPSDILFPFIPIVKLIGVSAFCCRLFGNVIGWLCQWRWCPLWKYGVEEIGRNLFCHWCFYSFWNETSSQNVLFLGLNSFDTLNLLTLFPESTTSKPVPDNFHLGLYARRTWGDCKDCWTTRHGLILLGFIAPWNP